MSLADASKVQEGHRSLRKVVLSFITTENDEEETVNISGENL